MAQQIQEIMTTQVHTVHRETTLLDVARMMRDRRIGDVLVANHDGSLCGIVTDRDIVVRADAEGRPLERTQVGEICTDQVIKLEPTASIDEAMNVMREYAVRRVPVVRDGKVVGILSIGDIARSQEPTSALAEISAAEPNN